MTLRTIVDPPSGWLYEFPRVFDFIHEGDPCDREAALGQWFVDCGYPKKLVDDGMLKYCRFWEEEDDDVGV